MRRLVGAGLLCVVAVTAAAADYRADSDNYREFLPHLQAGDRLLLEPGDYRRGLPLGHLAGSPGHPIVIEAADPGRPPRFIARPGANTVSLVDVRHLVLRDLELDGRNVPVDAVKAEGTSHFADFITLEHLYIHDHAASQQNVGISTKCPAFGWVIRDNRIERVGTGMYLGDSDGSDAFISGLIEGNHVSATTGYNLQIKHQKSRPSGYADRYDTVIRCNVFSKRDALPGPQARPNVLLGHLPLSGAGSEDRYLVYGNLLLGNPSEALFQAEGRVAAYDNVFINDSGDAIHIQPHNDVPRDMLIFSNTVLVTGTGIQVRRAEGTSYHQRVVANVVSASTPVRGGEASFNVELAYDPEFLRVPVPELTARLLATAGQQQPLPGGLVKELTTFPDWREASKPGAQVPASLVRTLDAHWP